MDAYGLNNSTNYFVEPVSFAEIQYKNGIDIFGTPEAGEMMHRSGKASANDIEMLLEAGKTGKRQYFVPIGRTLNEDNTTNKMYGLSKAIRANYIYRATEKLQLEILKLKKGVIIITSMTQISMTAKVSMLK